MNYKSNTIFFIVLLFVACGESEVPKIKFNVDQCDYCRMNISDGKFAAALITKKGRTYKFDDLSCMLKYKTENTNSVFKQLYISDFIKTNTMLPVEQAFYLESEKISGPMQGHIAAFANRDSALFYQKLYDAKLVAWELIIH